MSSTPSHRSHTPRWRSSLSAPKKQKPAAGVSVVFAQPEPGARLASAIDRLPAVPIDDASSLHSVASRKRERLYSNASSFVSTDEQRTDYVEGQVGRDIKGIDRKRSRLTNSLEHEVSGNQNPSEDAPGSATNPLDLTESPKPMVTPLPSYAQPEQAQHEAPSVLEPPAQSNPQSQEGTGAVPFPTSDPTKTIRVTKSTPSRSSWFFSRTKPADSAHSPVTQSQSPVSGANPEDPLPTAPQAAATDATIDFPPLQAASQAASDRSTPRDIPSGPSSNAKPSPMRFSPHQYSPPTPSSLAHNFKSATTSISSVDEEVPRLNESTLTITPSHPIAVVESQDVGSRAAGRKPSISSLNPSTSRFTLRLPLLGRPKVPLEQAVASAQGEDVRVQSGDKPDGNTSGESAIISDSVPAAPQTVNIIPPSPGADGTAIQEQHMAKDGSRPASWWDYIGWTANGEDGKPPQDSAQVECVGMEESVPSNEAEQSAEPPQPEALAEAPQDPVSDRKTASILSAETVKSHGASWYSPWVWYYSSANPENANVTSASGMTDAEMVKEDALARDTQAEATPAVPAVEPEREATPEPSNPIQSSVADNKAGWMSFFMSKALATKALPEKAYESKEDGMEVMEIDDDEPDPSVAVEVATSSAIDIGGASKMRPTPLELSSSPKPSSPTPSSPPKTPHSTPTKSPKKPESAPPLTESESIKRAARAPSPAPSKASATSTTPPGSAKPVLPNLVLPTWSDTFHTLPRACAPPARTPSAKSKLTGALSSLAGALFLGGDGAGPGGAKGKGKARVRAKSVDKESLPHAQQEFVAFGQDLPKALDVVGEALNPYILNGGCRVVVIGVAGWSPGAVTRKLAGGLPSSSSKFVNMTVQALEQFAEESGFKFKKITPMPLEGDGMIRKKVSRVYNHLLENDEWLEDLHAADVIFVASHSQGAVVSTHLLDRLIEDGHILTARSVETLTKTAASTSVGGIASVPTAQAQRVCLLTLCGIHLGPLRYLKTSSLLQPYIQYVENAAARELFEFQDTESKASKNYTGALRNILDHGAKVVYIASLNDQVVPIYSGLFTAASHPRILRALYIDNDAYHSSDFLSNLLILLIRIRNAGMSDRGLLAHLSEATAGTLNGIGHSTAYEEPATYSLAVRYFFMTNDGPSSDAELVIDPFNAVEEQNDYEIPWLLRDMIADDKISHFFAREFAQLRDAFDDWQPKTTILRDVKKKLQPITRMSTKTPQASGSLSKL